MNLDAIKTKPNSRFLVCDDERHVARLLQLNLERHGHQVTCVHGGREALNLLEHETFDGAVIDLLMPDVDGVEVVAHIRSHEHMRTMKIILMTSRDKSIDEWARANVDADWFFRK